MSKPADHDNKAQDAKDGPTYHRSVKIGDPGGATEANPNPTRPFVNPDPESIHDFGD
jgi:hypothetical protein